MPDEEKINIALEFGLAGGVEGELSKRYGIVFGGRVVEMLEGGKTGFPQGGIIHNGNMSFYLMQNEKLGEEMYRTCVRDLELCKKTASAIFGQKALWEDMDTIMHFYHVIKGQSDSIIHHFAELHPEFQELSLPEISPEHLTQINEALRAALSDALSKLNIGE